MTWHPFAIPLPTDLLTPVDPTLVAAECTPIWAATVKAVPEARGCKCGALLDAPCTTRGGKVTHDHAGRGRVA